MAQLIPTFASNGTPLSPRRSAQAQEFIDNDQADGQYHPETGELIAMTFREGAVPTKIYPLVSAPSVVKERVGEGVRVWKHREWAA